MNKENIGLVVIGDVGQEAAALRECLEYFGMKVIRYNIGRPNDLIALLDGSQLYPDIKTLLFCCHGEDGKIIMPELGSDIYFSDEPRGNFGQEEILKYGVLKEKNVICTGCTTGHLSAAFISAGCKNFIGSEGYIEGDTSLLFVIKLFYHLNRTGDFRAAFSSAQQGIIPDEDAYQLYY